MAVQVSYPGVYIEEFAPGAPIQGVSTSIAAFIGLTQRGRIDAPEKITNWDQFLAMYGERPVTGSYLWYAVRGFFDNGGRVCYIVRASNGTYSEGTITNREDEVGGTAEPLVLVRARQPGSTTLTVTLTEVQLLDSATTTVYQPTGALGANASGRTIELGSEDEAVQFRPGDVLAIDGVQPVVVRVRGAEIILDRDVTAGAGTNVRLADVAAGSRTLRISPDAPLPPGTLVPGTVLTITQNGSDDTRVVEAVQTEHLALSTGTEVTYRVTFRDGLDIPLDMTTPATVESHELDVQVAQNGSGPTYSNLGADPAHPNYFVDVINREDAKVEMELIEPPPVATLPGSLPKADPAGVSVAGGNDEQLANIQPQDYIDALDALQEVDEVSIVTVPGVTAPVVQQAMIAHCEQMADRFAVLDSAAGIDLFGDDGVEGQRRQLDSARGYAALYYPWLTIVSPLTGRNMAVPPSGHICGIMARTDQNRGVHKAPAGNEATVDGAIGVEATMSDVDQGLLNLQNINVIRSFKGGRPIVWGARTTATDSNWQYVNIRRLFLFLEESIQEGIRWAVFEPNNLQLWQKLRRSITEFLTRVWRDGALFGATAEEAFYVRIDEALNPFSERQLGRLNIEIGISPSYPAEFIIVRIGIWPGGSEVSEG